MRHRVKVGLEERHDRRAGARADGVANVERALVKAPDNIVAHGAGRQVADERRAGLDDRFADVGRDVTEAADEETAV